MPAEGRLRREAVEAAARVVAAGGRGASLGVVLGTGLGEIVHRFDHLRLLSSTASGWLPGSTATGHAGMIASGLVGSCPVVALQGRVHAYEGFDDATITRGIELLVALGARTILLTNASGGLRPEMRSGDLLIVEDHLDFVQRPADGAAMTAGGCRSAGWYPPRLVHLALAASRRAGVPAQTGVYARLLGPSYETRSEYRMLLRFGADAVGMSTVPEAIAARRLGVDVAAVSVVTNVARPDAPQETDADDVCRLAATASDGVWAILAALAEDAVSASTGASAS